MLRDYVTDRFSRVWCSQMAEKKKKEAEQLELEKSDPFDLEAQKKIADHIRYTSLYVHVRKFAKPRHASLPLIKTNRFIVAADTFYVLADT